MAKFPKVFFFYEELKQWKDKNSVKWSMKKVSIINANIKK